MRISDDGPWFAAATCKANFLKQAEQFEDDYDNNNYSDYVEDASVHAVTDIRLSLRWRAFMQAELRRWHEIAFADAVDSTQNNRLRKVNALAIRTPNS
jgi:hypothetical protein